MSTDDKDREHYSFLIKFYLLFQTYHYKVFINSRNMKVLNLINANDKECEHYGMLFNTRSLDNVDINYNRNWHSDKIDIINSIVKDEIIVENTGKNVFYSNSFTESKEIFTSGLKSTIKVFESNEYSFLITGLEYSPYSSVCITSGNPFILLLGIPSKEEDATVQAFLFSGEEGICIFPNVWFSQPLVYYRGKVTFFTRENFTRMRIRKDCEYRIDYA